MKNLYRILSLILVALMVFALASCGGDKGSVGGIDNGGGNKNDDKATKVELSNAIKAAMKANDQLTTSNYFLASDGTIIGRTSNNDKKEAGVYAQLGNVKKIIKGAGTSSFALTENGDVYHEDRKIAENVTMAAYCTTNVNVEGFCVINNELRRINSYRQLEDKSLNYMFKNYPSEEKLSGEITFIEADKHDFIVLNAEGKFFAYWTSEEYGTLDYTGFEGLAIVDIAKHMGENEVESLTVAGVKGDGTPVATGTYAEDILSWGKLADLAMSDGMIVGLTEDGKLKMTGDYAEKMKETVEGWTNIVGIEVGYATGGNIDYIVTAVDANGTFYYASLMNERYDVRTGTATANGVSDDSTWLKYTPDGTKYYTTYEGTWEAESED